MDVEKAVLVKLKSQDMSVCVSVADVECVNAKLLDVIRRKLEKYEYDVDFLKSSELRAFANILETISRVAIATERLKETKGFEYEDKVEVIQKIVGSRKWRDNALKMK
jgi:hypothetical protein